jgi:hypothetical protein
MSLEQVKAAYPGCPDAIDWLERPQSQGTWEQARVGDVSPERAVAILQLAVAVTILTVFPTIGGVPKQVAALTTRILDQMEHPDFLRYVAGKLGSV